MKRAPRGATWLGALALAAFASGEGDDARAATKTKEVDPCSAEAAADASGSLAPFRAPTAKALELNAAGKAPYRQGKWDEARAQYRAALAADPEFLAPKLNVACSFVRQERFAEATAEVVALLDHAYVPWAREILDAADLGALKVRPEMKQIQRALDASAARWGQGLEASVLFVARQRPALRVPDGPGTFILNPHQEVWAYVPRTRRYRQLTTEDGHVVAFAPALEGGRLLYVTAEKLVRGARPEDLALRGVAVRELTLATMTLGPRLVIEGDVRRLAIFERDLTRGRRRSTERPGRTEPVGRLLLEVATDGEREVLSLEGATLVLTHEADGRRVDPLAVLTPKGVGPTLVPVAGGACDLLAADARDAGTARVILKSDHAASLTVPAPWGAGLRGLQIP